MPQTILALFALMLSSTFALQQSRHVLQTEMNMVRQEAQTHARGVASDVFAQIASLPFDEATATATATAAGRVPVSALTPEPFEEGLAFADAADVDDVHEMRAYVVTRTLTRPDGTTGRLTFSVTATVDYAELRTEGEDEVMRPTPDNSRTYTKLVTLRVRCLDLDASMWGASAVLTLARPYSYTPA
jgi:hypothetical protein